MPPKKQAEAEKLTADNWSFPVDNYQVSSAFDNMSSADMEGLQSRFGLTPEFSAFAEARYGTDRGDIFGLRGEIPEGTLQGKDTKFEDPRLSAYLKANLGRYASIEANAGYSRGRKGSGAATLKLRPTEGTRIAATIDNDAAWKIKAEQELAHKLKAKAMYNSKREWEATVKYKDGPLSAGVGVKDGPNRPNPYYNFQVERKF